MDRMTNLTLPEWAWLDGGDHEKGGDPLEGRNVVLHVRSASVIEFLEPGNFVPARNVQSYAFTYKNIYGCTERHIAVLHYCAVASDKKLIGDILVAASEWYCQYLTWEDGNIIKGETASRK